MVDPLLVHRCITCRFRWDLCLCEIAPRLVTAARVVVVMHMKEWRRSSNTGHYARLAIRDASVIQHGDPRTGMLDVSMLASAGPESPPDASAPLVLSPGSGSAILTPELAASLAPRRVVLIVPDGSWGQASGMIKRIPGLAELPRVALPGLAADVPRMRRNLKPDRMSTFEAISRALGALEGSHFEELLDAFYTCLIARMQYLRGFVSMTAVTTADAGLAARQRDTAGNG